MSEVHLLTAVRDRIRAHGEYLDKHCNVEWDEMAPATAPDLYIMVLFGSVEAGPATDGGAAQDLLYGVNVSIAIRAPRKPRDRSRDLWLALTGSFYKHQGNILDQLDFDYTTINNANSQMILDGEATGTCDTFIEPLRFASLGPIRPAPAEIFAGTPGESVAALIRTIRFRGARRIVTRN